MQKKHVEDERVEEHYKRGKLLPVEQGLSVCVTAAPLVGQSVRGSVCGHKVFFVLPAPRWPESQVAPGSRESSDLGLLFEHL